MPPISKPEVRFKEDSGVRFLSNGRVRCHGLAKSKVKEWRELYNDYDTSTDDLWPECQCGMPAEDGQYVCRFHGGLTPRTVRAPRTMLDVLPIDMADKYRALMDAPDYISRKEDINVLQVRTRMLMEDLQQKADSEEVMGLVHESLVKLKRGDVVNAQLYLEEALQTVDSKKQIWEEFYKVEKLLGEMTSTQMKTMKDLQSMATVEQVTALVSTLLNLINNSSKDYIPDPVQRSQFTRMFVAEVQQLLGTTPQKMIVNVPTNTD